MSLDSGTDDESYRVMHRKGLLHLATRYPNSRFTGYDLSAEALMQGIRASSRLGNNLDQPIAPLVYTLSTMHCMTVSLAQGVAGLGSTGEKDLH